METEGPGAGNVVIKTEDTEVTAAYQEIKLEQESSQQDKTPLDEEDQNIFNSCECCAEGRSLEPHGLFDCGSCGSHFDSICRLHTHIQSHGLGGSYHYDHRSRTAFPKYGKVCSDYQIKTPADFLKHAPKSRTNTAETEERMLQRISKSASDKIMRENNKIRFNKTNMAGTVERHDKDSEPTTEQQKHQSLKRGRKVTGQQTDKTSRIKRKTRQTIQTKADSKSDRHGEDKDKVVEDSRTDRISSFKIFDMQMYNCFKCKLVFSSEEFLQAHMRKHQSILVCDCCNEIFQSMKELQKHVIDGEGNDLKAVEMFVCSYCALVITELKGLLAHFCVSAEDLALNRQTVRIYTGTVTKKKELYESIPLTKDDTIDNTQLKVQCETCHVWFENDYFLTMHSVVHRYMYKCSKCSLHFMSEVDRDQHNISCINPASCWICSICGKRFNRQQALTGHRETHKDTKDSQCELCGKTFKTKRILKVHIKTCPSLENRERKFSCEICGKRFFVKRSMRWHMETVHSDVRRFVCEICGAGFKSKDSLKYHLLRHTKDRPTLDCDICGASFRDMVCFRRHKKRHTELCTEKCTYCGKMFYERWNLKAHLRQHTGEKPYKCDTCGQGFTHNISRKTHMKKCCKT